MLGEVFANGKHLATLSTGSNPGVPAALYFHHTDWLGTERVRTNGYGEVYETCTSWPYGDNLHCSANDVTQTHFTGKERDTESGLDYFGARYYGSSMGRFMSPDDGADAVMGVPVPYADLSNPQSLNLYSYVINNPLAHVDPDGNDYQVCVNGGNCVNLTDEQYHNLYNQQNGKQGINMPGFPGGAITCGGVNCGSAKYFEPGLVDESGGQLAGIALGMGVGKAVGAAWGAVAGWLGRGAGEAAGAAVETGGSTAAKVLLNAGTKQEAKAVVEGLADGAQKASAKRAIAAATRSESVSVSQSADGTITVARTRPGFDGSQTFTKTIDSSGNSSTVQTAHDASGNLVHYDPKH